MGILSRIFEIGRLLQDKEAEAVLQRLEVIVFQTFTPKLRKRYVDDTFVIIDSDKLSDFHIALNNALPGIQFTLDKEKDRTPFLNILIHRLPTGTLQISVYRKSTHSDVVLNFHSNSPVSHKHSCIKALFSRLHTHCSTPVARKAEQAYLYKTFQNNGYQINFIRQATRPPRGTTTTSNEPENLPSTICSLVNPSGKFVQAMN